MQNAKQALEWISRIFAENHISYMIVGGIAANAYGSPRPIADIDIWTSGRDFRRACRLVENYIVIGPTYYRSPKWDAEFANLNYKGQEIDIGNGDNTKIFDNRKNDWHNISLDYSNPTIKDLLGLRLPVIPKDKLIEYKTILARVVDAVDIHNIQKNQNR